MKTAKLFMNGRSQAVRLPKEFRLEGNEVEICRQGNSIVLVPIVNQWQQMFEKLDKLSVAEDFMADREQPPQQKRPELDDFFQ
ncbi:type II toxin-antitoxin system antitoxin VapB [Candidatus Venteria ishoeyi]|uniref:Antitoxin VapB n=1 Tax=Candidatus Venteria ishoeyi TaxID=1899563 RepID=A0A1H6F4F1_9GAMM|nr:type II toxin-antitoxin system VapB family antitoxin [Candidatus Venteria ishoeyi]SEH04972.1 Antitoxin VapB [Candidatus Venteria ishoeyi]